VQEPLDEIGKEDKHFSNLYLKAVTRDENKRKQSEMREEGAARCRCGLNTLQTMLFIGK